MENQKTKKSNRTAQSYRGKRYCNFAILREHEHRIQKLAHKAWPVTQGSSLNFIAGCLVHYALDQLEEGKVENIPFSKNVRIHGKHKS